MKIGRTPPAFALAPLWVPLAALVWGWSIDFGAAVRWMQDIVFIASRAIVGYGRALPGLLVSLTALWILQLRLPIHTSGDGQASGRSLS